MGHSEDVTIGGCRAVIQGLSWQNFQKEDRLWWWPPLYTGGSILIVAMEVFYRFLRDPTKIRCTISAAAAIFQVLLQNGMLNTPMTLSEWATVLWRLAAMSPCRDLHSSRNLRRTGSLLLVWWNAQRVWKIVSPCLDRRVFPFDCWLQVTCN